MLTREDLRKLALTEIDWLLKDLQRVRSAIHKRNYAHASAPFEACGEYLDGIGWYVRNLDRAR